MPPVEDRWVALTMRQTHVGGDKLFVDFAGDTVPVIVDRPTGEARRAQIFVAARISAARAGKFF
jgi:transposase